MGERGGHAMSSGRVTEAYIQREQIEEMQVKEVEKDWSVWATWFPCKIGI